MARVSLSAFDEHVRLIRDTGAPVVGAAVGISATRRGRVFYQTTDGRGWTPDFRFSEPGSFYIWTRVAGRLRSVAWTFQQNQNPPELVAHRNGTLTVDEYAGSV